MNNAQSRNRCHGLLAAVIVCTLVSGLCSQATAAPHVFPDPTLPPVHPDDPTIAYYGKNLHMIFPQGVIMNDPIHKNFRNVQREAVAFDEHETFTSTLETTVDVPGMEIFAAPVTLTGPVTVRVRDYTSGQTGTFATEIIAMNLTGSIGPTTVVVRESPSMQSLGSTTITDLGGGLYEIDSFFDVFTELSVDGGPFYGDLSGGPSRMELCPEPATMSLLALGGLALLRRRKK